MMSIITYTKIETIVLYFVTKKNLGISLLNGPEYETTSLTLPPSKKFPKIFKFSGRWRYVTS